jgi:tRNA (cytidine/uridine-2'-O-)-methyltransferase
VFRILFHTPEIPGNTGAAIRLAAVAGAELHLVEPLGFSLEDSKLKRAGLDYHDLTVLHVHASLDEAWTALQPERVFAYTSDGDDVLLFGRESDGLPHDVKHDSHITSRVRVPMLPSRRSLNLANTASIVLYEAWRQQGFAGAQR